MLDSGRMAGYVEPGSSGDPCGVCRGLEKRRSVSPGAESDEEKGTDTSKDTSAKAQEKPADKSKDAKKDDKADKSDKKRTTRKVSKGREER